LIAAISLRFGGGLGGIAMCSSAWPTGIALPRLPLRLREWERRLCIIEPRAKRVVQLFQSGAASQCDTFDYKPELIKRSGEKFEPGGKVEFISEAIRAR